MPGSGLAGVAMVKVEIFTIDNPICGLCDARKPSSGWDYVAVGENEFRRKARGICGICWFARLTPRERM